MAKKYSKELEELIIKYHGEGKSPYWMVENIPELQGKRPSVLYGVFKRLGLETSKKYPRSDTDKRKLRKYNLNDDYFDIINSEHKAYWLGFMYADGWILSATNKVGITLSVKDIDVLEKFKRDLSAESPINIYEQKQGYAAGSEYARIILTSEKLKNDLIKHGVYENKTTIIKFPDFIDESLLFHFIRGYFDGDGCITHSNFQKNGNKDYLIKIVGTKSFIEGLQKSFNTNLKIHQRHPDRNVDNWSLTIGGNKQVRRILDMIYKDSTIHIERKYNKYLELKEIT